MTKKIYEVIDSLAHTFADRKKIPALRDFLIASAPEIYLKVDRKVREEWTRAVTKYTNELQKLEDWNRISKQFSNPTDK